VVYHDISEILLKVVLNIIILTRTKINENNNNQTAWNTFEYFQVLSYSLIFCLTKYEHNIQ
jgi:hypothetical protein